MQWLWTNSDRKFQKDDNYWIRGIPYCLVRSHTDQRFACMHSHWRTWTLQHSAHSTSGWAPPNLTLKYQLRSPLLRSATPGAHSSYCVTFREDIKLRNGLQLCNDYGLVSCWSTALLINYHRHLIDWSVNEVPQITQMAHYLSWAVCNDVKLPRHPLKVHGRSTKGRVWTTILFNARTNWIIFWLFNFFDLLGD